jgi:hypothetical protein
LQKLNCCFSLFAPIIHKALQKLWRDLGWVNSWSKKIQDFMQHEDALDSNGVPCQTNLGKV